MYRYAKRANCYGRTDPNYRKSSLLEINLNPYMLQDNDDIISQEYAANSLPSGNQSIIVNIVLLFNFRIDERLLSKYSFWVWSSGTMLFVTSYNMGNRYDKYS